MPDPPTRVLIADDHALMRDGLRTILERTTHFQVAAQAANAQDAMRQIQAHPPDIALVDISLPGKSGIELTRWIRKNHPQVKVLIVTMNSRVEYLAEAFRAGAQGYIVKESASDQLIKGMQAVLQNRIFVDSAASPEIVRTLAADSTAPRPADASPAYATLTPREQEILRLLAQGLSAKEAAAQLYISPKTVENHRTNIMRKLDIHTTMELIRYAARIGLIDLTEWTNP